jgi:hypothetical protein
MMWRAISTRPYLRLLKDARRLAVNRQQFFDIQLFRRYHLRRVPYDAHVSESCRAAPQGQAHISCHVVDTHFGPSLLDSWHSIT